MQHTEKQLLMNSLTLVQMGDLDYNFEDMLLGDDATMSLLVSIMTESGDALKSLIKVINATKMRDIVTTAEPVEVIPLRHEIVGAEEVYERLEKYVEIYKRREKEKDKPMTDEEEEPQATP